jgi:hypothetical protein
MKPVEPRKSSDSSRQAGMLPIACTLSASDLKDRVSAWSRLIGSGTVECNKVPGGVRLQVPPSLAPGLARLIDLERACCPWIHFEVSEDGCRVTLTAEGGGEAVLQGMFGELVSAIALLKRTRARFRSNPSPTSESGR